MQRAHPIDGARILLVDDDPDHVEMYRLALEYGGFVVSTAATGGEALTRAREESPDLIVLDLRLPDINGFDVCARLKEHPQTASIPVLLLTAAVTPTLPREAAAAGCAGFLFKPCYPDQLIASIREILAGT
jgi:CheY-like chemotaxis protein